MIYEIQWGLGAYDMFKNYLDMREAWTIGADKYFHCMANCQASNRGDGGSSAAEYISDLREELQESSDGKQACEEDQIANRHGRKGGNCKKRCAVFRPVGLDSKW
jgi:hypothetical protein